MRLGTRWKRGRRVSTGHDGEATGATVVVVVVVVVTAVIVIIVVAVV